MSHQSVFQIPTHQHWQYQLLQWLDEQFEYFAFFQSNGISYPYDGFPDKIYAGSIGLTLDQVDDYKGKSDIVGILSYDLKNQIENLSSHHPSAVACRDSDFFVPELTIEIKDGVFHVKSGDEFPFEKIFGVNNSLITNPVVKVNPLTSKEKYFADVKFIQNHIREGDMYELNYCMGFTFQDTKWNPIIGFLDLMQVSPMPFSALFKSGSHFLVAASPERFLKREEQKMIAQPIKGTIKRGETPQEDKALKEQLLRSEKERAENLMIVDLMRNDLSKVSEVGSVRVEELFGVYPFAKVHQMISTVTSTLRPDVSFAEIIRSTFPMGSMTGAPKIKCMELIERYENFKRGWFSGALGIVEANGNFDFNVVIRSIIFDKGTGKGYFAVGSAITYDADAAYEYEECLLKASAILGILTHKE
jgi:para-aminobenzoate synthetase component I